MQYASILNIHSISDTDRIDITTKYRAEPNTTIASYFHISDDNRIIC